MLARSDIVPDRQEIWSSIFGAFRLACFDRTGHQHFNISVEGFWRSFFAAVLVAPGHAILVSHWILSGDGSLSIWTLTVHMTIYAANWIIFPLVLFFVIDLLGLGHRFTALIVAVNWTEVIAVPIMILALGTALLLPSHASGLVREIAFIGLVIFHWFVIRTALQTTGIMALAFLLFGLVLNGMLGQLANRLL